MTSLSNYIRIDKNLAFNIDDFNDYEQDQILTSLITFMACKHQKDLFGFCKIDPKEFAKEMGFNVNHLFKIHPEPKQLESKDGLKLLAEENINGRMSESRTWSTYLENALYILSTRTIIDDYRYKTAKKSIASVKTFILLEEIRIEIVKIGKTKKVVYKYKPNPKFEENLKSYFLNIKLEKYVTLKKPRLNYGYIQILNRINNANQNNLNSITFNIDTLAKILHIEPHSRFSNYKRKVTSKFEKLKETIDQDVKGLQLVWGKNSDHIAALENKLTVNKPNTKVRYDNTPIIIWEKPNPKLETSKNYKIFKNIFDTELIKGITKAFFSLKDKKIETNFLDDDQKVIAFYDWFFSEEGMDIKLIKFRDTFVDVYNTTKSLVKFELDFKNAVVFFSQVKLHESYDLQYTEDSIRFSYPVKDEKQVVEFEHLYQLLNFHYKYKKQ